MIDLNRIFKFELENEFPSCKDLLRFRYENIAMKIGVAISNIGQNTKSSYQSFFLNIDLWKNDSVEAKYTGPMMIDEKGVLWLCIYMPPYQEQYLETSSDISNDIESDLESYPQISALRTLGGGGCYWVNLVLNPRVISPTKLDDLKTNYEKYKGEESLIYSDAQTSVYGILKDNLNTGTSSWSFSMF